MQILREHEVVLRRPSPSSPSLEARYYGQIYIYAHRRGGVRSLDIHMLRIQLLRGAKYSIVTGRPRIRTHTRGSRARSPHVPFEFYSILSYPGCCASSDADSTGQVREARSRTPS